MWGEPAANPWLSALLDGVEAASSAPRFHPQVCRVPSLLSESGALADVLAAAGFQGVDVREVAVPMHVGSFDEWWRIARLLAGPIAALLSSLPDDITSAIRSDAESVLADFATETGYAIPGRSLVGVGHH